MILINDKDGDGQVDDSEKEHEFEAALARVKVVKFDIAKKDQEIAKLQAQRQDADLKLTTLEMNVKTSIQGLWTESLKGA